VFLVDTSVWIGYLRGAQTEAVSKLDEIQARGYPFGITSLICQEILQGADSEASFTRFDHYLRTQIFYHPADPVGSYLEAARLYARCRWAGITIRSTVDCLIAQVAIEHGLILLHDDRDFDHMARVIPDLRIH
jgi:predicted nucleic acid-binding protein